MSNSWFRMYAEFANDPKVQMMSEQDQRRLVMLLCLRCNGDVTLHETEIAFQLRISNEEWLQTKAVFIEKGFIDEHNNVLNWDKRQFISDSSRERVARHRRNKKLLCNVTVTPPDTDTDTDINNCVLTNTIKKTKNKTTPTKKIHETAALIALGIDLDLAQDFLKIRKTKLTQTAINAIVREANKAEISPSDAVRICIERSWQSFNAGWNWNPQEKNRGDPTRSNLGLSENNGVIYDTKNRNNELRSGSSRKLSLVDEAQLAIDRIEERERRAKQEQAKVVN